MLVIEGAGRLGKTTAAKKIVDATNALGLPSFYNHMGRPKPPFDFGRDYFPMINLAAVQDRFHLGGVVWHTTEETGLTDAKIQIINAKIRAAGGMIVVFFSDDDEWYREQWQKSRRESELFDVNVHSHANQTFRRISGDYADFVVNIRNGDFVTDKWINRVAEEWRLRREFAC